MRNLQENPQLAASLRLSKSLHLLLFFLGTSSKICRQFRDSPAFSLQHKKHIVIRTARGKDKHWFKISWLGGSSSITVSANTNRGGKDRKEDKTRNLYSLYSSHVPLEKEISNFQLQEFVGCCFLLQSFPNCILTSFNRISSISWGGSYFWLGVHCSNFLFTVQPSLWWSRICFLVVLGAPIWGTIDCPVTIDPNGYISKAENDCVVSAVQTGGKMPSRIERHKDSRHPVDSR